MGSNFTKLKSKAFKVRLIKSSLLGAGLALFTIGLLFLLSTLELVIIKPIFSIFIGIGVFVAAFVFLYLLLNRSNSRFAKELDRKYELNEKIQTMLVYKDHEGAMCELQRDDAESSLANVQIKVFDFKKLWAYLLCLVLGVAMLVTALVVKPKEEDDTPPAVENIPFKITQLQIAAVEELIEYVNASSMASPYKENVSLTISTMLNELRLVTTEEERDVSISKAMDAIYEQTGQSSMALELINELWKTGSASTKLLAKALNYYDWPRADEEDKFLAEISELRKSFVFVEAQEQEESTEEEKALATKQRLSAVSMDILTALQSVGVGGDDGLYLALVRLASAKEENQELGTKVYGLSTLVEYIDSVGYTDGQRELDATFTALNNSIFSALSQHSDNTGTGEYAMTRIADIFKCKAPEFERPKLYDSTDDSSGSDENSGSNGAISNGTIYGSDDLVYNPFTNEYVEYGTILDTYYSIMFKVSQSGDYTEEEKQAMEKYFSILYGGFDEEKEEEGENNQ